MYCGMSGHIYERKEPAKSSENLIISVSCKKKIPDKPNNNLCVVQGCSRPFSFTFYSHFLPVMRSNLRFKRIIQGFRMCT